MARHTRQRSSGPRDAAPASDSRPTVLILDDDPWVRESIRFLMHDDGYAVLEADGATQALELLRAQPRLIVLIDLVLRNGSGFQVIEALSHDDALAARHAAIVCTAHKSKPEDIGTHFAALLERLEIPFIAKPFDIDTLSAAVDAAARRLAARAAPWSSSDAG